MGAQHSQSPVDALMQIKLSLLRDQKFPREALALDDQPITVVLDLMEPVGTGGDLGGAGRDAGLKR